MKLIKVEGLQFTFQAESVSDVELFKAMSDGRVVAKKVRGTLEDVKRLADRVEEDSAPRHGGRPKGVKNHNWRCKVCGKVFPTKAGKNVHMALVHQGKGRWAKASMVGRLPVVDGTYEVPVTKV